MQKVQELRQIGFERLEKLFRIVSSFPKLSIKILELFYLKREPLSISDIFPHVKAKKKRRVRYLVKKLLELELLEKTGRPPFAKRQNLNYYTISRLGLDLYNQIDIFTSDLVTADALGMSHSFKVLFALSSESNMMSWSALRDKLSESSQDKPSESSLARVLEALKNATLISKDQQGGYCLTQKGEVATETVSKLSLLTVPPAYEVQVKIIVDSLSAILHRLQKSGLSIRQGLPIRQEDYYLFPASSARSDSYLRYRIEQKLDAAGRFVGAPKRTLSWTQNVSPIVHHRIHIVRRKREDIEVSPTILFFLEYMDVRVKKKIVKIRHIVDTRLGPDSVKMNFDELQSLSRHRPHNFVEIKTVAWNEEEAREKSDRILELMNMLGLLEFKTCEKLYYELVRQRADSLSGPPA